MGIKTLDFTEADTYTVERSKCVIAVYNGCEKGGTIKTIHFFSMQKTIVCS